jgi:acetyl-CoA carboxylase biotin carboxyl carrier protein
MSTTKKKAPSTQPARKREAAPIPAGDPASQGLTLGLDDLKSLISVVAKESIDEFEFQSGDLSFRIRKSGSAIAALPAPIPAALPALPAMPTQTVVASVQPPAQEEKAEDPGIHHITSPIVGTFYRAPTPTGAAFVQPGDFVKPGQTLCIVEAMKLMNEIECDVAGEVVAVLVENGQPVEYGERLFAIRVR